MRRATAEDNVVLGSHIQIDTHKRKGKKWVWEGFLSQVLDTINSEQNTVEYTHSLIPTEEMRQYDHTQINR